MLGIPVCLLLTCAPCAVDAPAAQPVAAEAAVSAQAAPIRDDRWRRTTRGWEQTANWPRAVRVAPSAPPAPHPLVVAALLLLLSIGALVAFSPDTAVRRAEATKK